MVSLRRLRCVTLALHLVATCVAMGDDSLRYNRDVLPILAEHCFACHGVDSAKRAAGLRLDQREASLQKLTSGAHAIVPGNWQNSEVWKRVTSQDSTTRMPPGETGRTLSIADCETLRRWIELVRVRDPLGLHPATARSPSHGPRC